jgi:hypothetical protein
MRSGACRHAILAAFAGLQGAVCRQQRHNPARIHAAMFYMKPKAVPTVAARCSPSPKRAANSRVAALGWLHG